MNNYNQHHKNLTGGSPKQSNIAGSFCPPIKKMIIEVLLVLLSLYLILLFIWWRFRYLIQIMANVGDILSNNDFFGDVADTPKEKIEQHKNQKELKSVIDKDNAHLLGQKWTHGRVDKASDDIINKRYVEYRQRELNKKGRKTGKAWASMSLIYTLLEFLDGLKSRMLKNDNKTLRMTQSLKIRW